ncbi:MAG: hypothetical protein GX447_01995 [Elusimicrobia bacterium]|nr:hypothetical protein [Elusimicrobiota bacterium]
MENGIIKSFIEKNLRLAKSIWNGKNGSSLEAYSFIISSIKIIEPKISENLILNSITDGYLDIGIDAILIDKKNKTVSFFEAERTDEINYKNFETYLNAIDTCIFGAGMPKKFTNINLIKKAKNLITNSYKVKIYILRSKVIKKDVYKEYFKRLEKIKNKYSSISSVDILDAKRLVEIAIGEPFKKINYHWKIKNSSVGEDNKIVIKKNNSVETLIVRLSLLDILKLQEEYEKKGFNLFEQNVRGFQNIKLISEKIISTVKENPNFFYKYHNGITFSCDKVEILNKTKYKIYNPQIINGCQTVSSLYNAFKKNLGNNILKKSYVLCKFYSLKETEVESVCEATNTQIKINNWDLRANDNIQKKIELLLSLRSLKYARKSDKLKGRLPVYLVSLGQWIYACKNEEPAAAKNNKKKLFEVKNEDSIYRKIYNEKLTDEEVVNIYIIGNNVIQNINKKKSKLDKKFEKHANFHIMAAIYQFVKKDKNKTIDENFVFKKYNLALKIVKKIFKKIAKKHKENEDLLFNKVFTKEQNTWAEIKKEIYRKEK